MATRRTTSSAESPIAKLNTFLFSELKYALLTGKGPSGMQFIHLKWMTKKWSRLLVLVAISRPTAGFRLNSTLRHTAYTALCIRTGAQGSGENETLSIRRPLPVPPFAMKEALTTSLDGRSSSCGPLRV